MRVDVARNRERLLAAARTSIAAEGAAVPLRTIADRAGLSAASLYRHFPTRKHLLAAVYDAEAAHCQELLDHASASENALDGLVEALHAFADAEVRSPGFSITLVEPTADDTRIRAATAMTVLNRLVRHARLRAEVDDGLELDDVVVTILSLRTVAASDPTRAQQRCDRIITLFRRSIMARLVNPEGLRTSATDLPAKPPLPSGSSAFTIDVPTVR